MVYNNIFPLFINGYVIKNISSKDNYILKCISGGEVTNDYVKDVMQIDPSIIGSTPYICVPTIIRLDLDSKIITQGYMLSQKETFEDNWAVLLDNNHLDDFSLWIKNSIIRNYNDGSELTILDSSNDILTVQGLNGLSQAPITYLFAQGFRLYSMKGIKS